MLVKKLDCEDAKVISLIGGGGKTSTITRLARELNFLGHQVIVTTTTRLGGDEGLAYDNRLLTDQFPPGKGWADAKLPDEPLLLVGSTLDANKFVGVSPQDADLIHSLARDRYLLVEADGAAKKPFKAPAAHEPVIPGSSQLVIAVVGAWAIGLPVEARFLHRPELIGRLAGLELNDLLTVEAAAQVILHPEGYRKGIPEDAKFAVLINGIQTGNLDQAKKLAKLLKKRGLEQVLLTNVRHDPPVVEVV